MVTPFQQTNSSLAINYRLLVDFAEQPKLERNI